MSEYAGEVQRNTLFAKDTDAVESGELLRSSYHTGTDDITAPPNPHAFRGGLNGFENERELARAKARAER